MAQWQRKFAKWKSVKSPVSADEVDTLLKKVFVDRLQKIDGTSHEHKITVPELIDNHKYQFGFLIIPIKGGQQVKAPYLQKAYEAATLLGLFPPQLEAGEENDDDQDDLDD